MASRSRWDPSAGRRVWLHELAKGVEDDLEMGVVLLFQIVDFPGQVRMGDQQTAELDEGAHDLDVDPDGPGRTEDAGEHGDPMLGEGVREVFSMRSMSQS